MNKIIYTFLCSFIAFSFLGSATAATLTGDYQFDSDLTDSLGGPSLVASGGSVSGGRYIFAPNQGLRLTGGITDTSNYSIEFSAEYDSLTTNPNWVKMVDLNNLSTEIGLYLRGRRLLFYDQSSTGSLFITPNIDFHVVLSRDASGQTDGYINGILQWTFNDPASIASNILNFFEDDLGLQREAQSGSVDFIRIYDGALTATEVEILAQGGSIGGGNPIPEPATMMLFGLGLIGLAGVSRKK